MTHPRAWPCAWCVLAAVAAVALVGCPRAPDANAGPKVVTGSKIFTESMVLGEITRLLARRAGARAEHRTLGDTFKVWNALGQGEIDVYCEYTGTLTQEILAAEKPADEAALRAALERRGLRMSKPLGFSNNYALGMKRRVAEERGIRTVSDLKDHPSLKLVFSNEFLDRDDCWRGLRRAYGLPQTDVRGLAHDLAYKALDTEAAHVTDLYTTDPKIRRYDLAVLRDDKKYFPEYAAVLLYRADLEDRAPEVVRELRWLEGRLTEEAMTALNAEAEAADRGAGESAVAAKYLSGQLGETIEPEAETLAARLLKRTLEHLRLVAVSLGLAIITAVPLGILAARYRWLGQSILMLVAVVQTVPSVALLAFLIVLLRQVGALPAVVALYLYSLLPIVRNTYTGLTDIPLSLREAANSLALPALPRLYLIELPLASRAILAGVKTAAVINIGTATLGGLIGAGGYGQPIFIGINKENYALILEGAIPAVVMAVAVQLAFDGLERLVVPRGLRLKAAG